MSYRRISAGGKKCGAGGTEGGKPMTDLYSGRMPGRSRPDMIVPEAKKTDAVLNFVEKSLSGSAYKNIIGVNRNGCGL